MLRWLKTVVVSDREKARSTCQVGTRKAFQNRSPDVWVSVADDASKFEDDIRTEGPLSPLGMSLAGARSLARRCPAWRRREPGLLLLCGT